MSFSSYTPVSAIEATTERPAFVRSATRDSLTDVESINFSQRRPPSIFSVDSQGQPRGRRPRSFSRNRSNSRNRTSKNTLESPIEYNYKFPAHFVSRRLTQPSEKPWKGKRKDRGLMLIPIGGIIIGLLLGAYLAFRGYQSVPRHKFCEMFTEDWSQGIREEIWNREIQVGGFGNGEFDWTTANDRNAYVDNGVLRIVPTLTDEDLTEGQVVNGYTLNLTADGTCTSQYLTNCVAVSNSSTNPRTIINPVQSARLTTQGKFSMKYGKIEIRAKMPVGDWLWPAIWMMPEDSIYGDWPRSGEIDIAESKGNGRAYPDGGKNVLSSTLHWGPAQNLDGFYKTTNGKVRQHEDYTDGFNTFGLEWTDKYLYTYINTHLTQVLKVDFNQPFYQRGKYPPVDPTNKTSIDNPWGGRPNNAPFDQNFFLILNVAVGGTNGYFPDGRGGKPWSNQSPTPMIDFYGAKAQWYPTWGKSDAERGMSVQSIKAWKLCD